MRYRDIVDYQIEMDEGVAGNTVLNLVLQPLVENALYHGIKNKRQGGTIIVRAQQKNGDEVLLASRRQRDRLHRGETGSTPG